MNKISFQILFYYYRALHPGCLVTARQPLAQALIESASFTSHVYQTNNNTFGMMAPQARDTTALNRGGKGYAAYSSPLDGVSDYFYWLTAMGITNDAQLDAFIKSGKYATDKAYYVKVQKKVAELQAAGDYLSSNLIYAGASVAAIATALGAGALINKALK
jgi:flagellum-specific peptidoglycan hydrolase FlgJ